MRILNESLNVLIINKSEISIHQAMNERSTTLLARLPVAMHTQMRFLHMKRKTNSPKTHFRKHLEHRHLQTPNQILRARRERRKVGTQRVLHMKWLFEFGFDMFFYTSLGIGREKLFWFLLFFRSVMLPHPLSRRFSAGFKTWAGDFAFQTMRQCDRHIKRHTLKWHRAMGDQRVHLKISRHFTFGFDAIKETT